jgi:pimeloyl-ACP methyl ester carboxylesterase
VLNLIARKLGRYSFAILWVAAAVVCASAQSRPPVVVIPGLTGSELINSKTGEKVWFKLRRAKGDDLRLPISTNLAANKDSLVAGDIIRDVKAGILPRADVYGGFIASLVANGYREGRLDAPPARGYENTIYVFAYDWRLDIVENSRKLTRQLDALKRKLRRPNLKFDVIGHSMGGLVARYAAMYGDTDLSANGNAAPTWAGAKNIGRLVIIAAPNEGSPLSLRDMVNGFALLGIEVNLPFVQSLSKFDVFTIPAAYELLPAPGTLRAFDQDLKDLDLDIYDPATWSKYGWDVTQDKAFEKEFSLSEQRIANTFFKMMLDRAKRFHAALDVPAANPPIPTYTIGAECKDTLDAVVLYQKKDGKWDAVFKADSFETPSGGKITSEELKAKIYVPGDGVVTKRSFSAATVSAKAGVESILSPISTTYYCEGHSKLPSNPEVQAKVFSILSAAK